MMNMMKKWLSLLLALILSGAMLLTGCSELGIELDEIIALSNQTGGYNAETEILPADEGTTLREDGHYSSKEEVGLYLYLYGKLPGKFKKSRSHEFFRGCSCSPGDGFVKICGRRFDRNKIFFQEYFSFSFFSV